MNKKHILIVSNPGVMGKNFFEWIGSTESYDLSFAESQEEAIELSHQHLYDMVMVDLTDVEINAKKLKAILPILNSEVLLVAYKGESVAELDEKVKQAFDYRKIKRLKKLLILESITPQPNSQVPPFSLN